MRNDTTTQVRVTRHFAVPAERVYDAWLDPATAGKWLFATDTGEMVKVEIDARVGGKFCFTDRRDGEDIDHVGDYIALDRPTRLVFEFIVPKYTQVYSTVTLDITADADGCDLILTHDGVWFDYAERTKAGWTSVLGKLADVVE